MPNVLIRIEYLYYNQKTITDDLINKFKDNKVKIIINAFLHNEWTNLNEPMIAFYQGENFLHFKTLDEFYK